MALSAAQHACRDRILTQAHPARIGNTVDAVVLKHGRLFMLADDRGDVPWRRPHGYGLFDGDTRVLDGFVLEIDGQPPTVLSATDTRGFEARHDLTNPELPQAGGGVLPCNTIAIRRERLIRGDVVHELLSVRNYGPGAARLTLSLRFRSRFEDIFIIKRFVRGPRGHVRRPRPRRDRVELAYDARDGARCTTVLASRRRPSDSPASAPSSSARWPRASAARSASASPPASSASAIASPVTRHAARARAALARAARPALAGARGRGALVECALRPRYPARAPGPPPAAREPARAPLLLRGRAVVLDALRPRRGHGRHPDAAVRVRNGRPDAAPARALPGEGHRRVPRRRARQDPARAAHR